MALKSLALLAVAQLASAHFGLEYPTWRTDTLSNEDGPYSQWIYPCEFLRAAQCNRPLHHLSPFSKQADC